MIRKIIQRIRRWLCRHPKVDIQIVEHIGYCVLGPERTHEQHKAGCPLLRGWRLRSIGVTCTKCGKVLGVLNLPGNYARINYK